MKFSPKCRTKKVGMIYTILGSFPSFFNWEWAVIRPQIRLGKAVFYVNMEREKCSKFQNIYHLYITANTYMMILT